MGSKESTAAFPTTEPAMKISVDISVKYPVGDTFTGSTLVTVPFSSGYIKSVPGFEPAFEFEVVQGEDWFYIDADKGHARVNVRAMAKDKDGVHIGVKLGGVVHLNEKVMPFLMGDDNAASSPFGSASENVIFEVGDPKYKFLEHSLWVCSQRFANNGGKWSSDLRISKVVLPEAMD